MPILYSLDYCRFILRLEVRQFKASNFVLFRAVLDIQGTLHLVINFRISLPISIQSADWNHIESIDQFEKNLYLNNTEFSNL